MTSEKLPTERGSTDVNDASPTSTGSDSSHNHSSLCKNISIARDYARYFKDLKDANGGNSELEKARSNLITSLEDVSQAESLSGESTVCPRCASQLSFGSSNQDASDWYRGKLQTDLWDLDSEAAQLGVRRT
ncbi:hypothetical protein I302_104913 [Kwoniella bestiolae CBS 10118]|uniref:Uncharacterized protein n=1 Tax=Kwoniella bestiolae CBS 10118 TaxID=1296100 RepID=A0A1B9FRG5_9TREE|nr:hypothetical protein I302_09016 [Kwoniella bestiolae CBS 10118]OCF21342.1 hypothetical protein I302_09016 [Kwoniella bestiolae CBS 10118]